MPCVKSVHNGEIEFIYFKTIEKMKSPWRLTEQKDFNYL